MSPELLDWAKESAVIDGDGRPLRVFHGSHRPLRVFRDCPTWFTESPGHAALYSMGERESYRSGSNIIPAYLDIRKPMDFLMMGLSADDYVTAEAFFKISRIKIPAFQGARIVHEVLRDPAFVQSARNAGFDGVKIMEHDASGFARDRGVDQAVTWFAFGVSQIRFAFEPKTLTPKRKARP